MKGGIDQRVDLLQGVSNMVLIGSLLRRKSWRLLLHWLSVVSLESSVQAPLNLVRFLGLNACKALRSIVEVWV